MITMYSDGGCAPNPGLGGWAALLKWQEHEKLISGCVKYSTNNRMEMWAVIEGLRCLKQPKSKITVYTDSKYLVHAFEKGWLEKWRRKGWVNSKKEAVKNQDLWRILNDLVQQHDVKLSWVPGHSGIEGNERVDQALRDARDIRAHLVRDFVYEAG